MFNIFAVWFYFDKVFQIWPTLHTAGVIFVVWYFPDLNRFSVHPDTGAFSSKASLEGLSKRSPIHFKVSAIDQGSPPKIGVTYVEVNITSGQLDDGLPYWTRPAPDTIWEIPEVTNSLHSTLRKEGILHHYMI